MTALAITVEMVFEPTEKAAANRKKGDMHARFDTLME